MTGPQGLRAFRSRWTLVSVATLAFWLAVQSLKPFVALHLVDLGASEVQVGMAVAAHPLLSLFLAIPAGRVIDQRGLRRYMLASLMTMVVVGAGYALTETVIQMAAMQLMAGLAELGAWIGIQALVTRAGETEFRRRHLALFSIAWGLGLAFGPSLGAWIFEVRGFATVALLYSCLSIGAVIAVAAVPHVDSPAAPQPDHHARTGMLAELRAVGQRPAILAVLAGSFVALWANSLRTSFYPLFLENSGLSVRHIGFLMSLAGVTTLLGRVPMVWLVRRFRVGPVLIAGTATAVVSLSATPLLVSSPALLAVGSALFGLGFGLNTPLTVDLMAEHSEESRRGLAMGMRVTSNRAAQVLQPLAFGGVAALLGMTAGFGVAGLVMAAGTALMTRWLRTEAPAESVVTDSDMSVT